jgi:hypothetical protein
MGARSIKAVLLAVSLASAPIGVRAQALVEGCAPDDAGFTRLRSADAEIAYRWRPETLKVGKFFELEVAACRMPPPGGVSRIIVDAQMPAHGHGMNYRPTSKAIGPDRYRFSGLMLHMAGKWRLVFDLMQGDKRTRLTQDIDVRP